MMFHFFTKPCGKGLYTYYVIMEKGVKAHLMTVIIPSVGGGKHQNDYVLHTHFCIINLKLRTPPLMSGMGYMILIINVKCRDFSLHNMPSF